MIGSFNCLTFNDFNDFNDPKDSKGSKAFRALKPLLDLKPYTAELLLDFILKPVALGEEGAEL